MTRLCAIGATSLGLTLCAGCSKVVEVPVPQIVRVMPPAHLLTATPEPVFTGSDNAALLDWALDNRDALRMCNADKEAALRAVRDEQ